MKVSEKEILAQACRESYRHFFIEFWDTVVPEKLIWNWHLDVLCDELQELSERVFLGQFKDHDTIFNVSPGSSKSLAASIMLLPWQWTRMPHFRSINASYAYPLALDLSRKSRDIVKSDKYQALFPDVGLRKDQDTKGYFANTKGGMRYAVGTRGSVTGMHGHMIVIDDPLDPNQAVSELEMDSANRWIQQTLLSRKIDRRITATALIMQRLAQGDPSDEMSKRRNVRHFIIPASDDYEIKPADFRMFYTEGLMDATRLPRDVLDDTAIEMGPYAYAGQYGQCLVAGTLVATQRGAVPIEQVTNQDRVITRKGMKRVLWSGETKRVKELTSVLFSNGAVITGTADHPVWTENNIWKPLDSIRGSDIISTHQEDDLWDVQRTQVRKSFTSGGSSTFAEKAIPTSSTGRREGTISTEMSGVITKEVYPLAKKSITMTETQRIIGSIIFDALPKRSTEKHTRRTNQRLIESFLIESDHLEKRGIPLKKELNTIKSLEENAFLSSGMKLITRSTPALTARKDSCQGLKLEAPSIARGNAKMLAAFENTVRSVPIAESHSRQKKSELSVAHAVVLLNGGEQDIPLYDLTVEDEPEFFANGILVHNSPVPAGGGMFRTMFLNYGTPNVRFKKKVRFWDKAGSRKNTGDFTSGVKLGITKEGNVWVLDVIRERVDTFQRERLIRATAERDGFGTVVGQEQEGASGGLESAQQTIRHMQGFRVKTIPAKKDKSVRADLFSQAVNAGIVTLAYGRWNEAYVEEMKYFPLSKYDDQIDASSGAYMLTVKRIRRIGGLRRREQILAERRMKK